MLVKVFILLSSLCLNQNVIGMTVESSRIVEGLADLIPKLADLENTELNIISDFKVSVGRRSG